MPARGALGCHAEPRVSLQNVTANHRASDTIVCEGKAQVLSGRFMYGPLDVVTLTGEKVLRGLAGAAGASLEMQQGQGYLGGDMGPVSPAAKGQGKRWEPGPRRIWRQRIVMTCRLGKQQLAGSALSPSPLAQVDIYIMTQPLSGKWLYYGTEVTSGSGRLTFTIPPDKALAIGIYPVRMVVR